MKKVFFSQTDIIIAVFLSIIEYRCNLFIQLFDYNSISTTQVRFQNIIVCLQDELPILYLLHGNHNYKSVEELSACKLSACTYF